MNTHNIPYIVHILSQKNIINVNVCAHFYNLFLSVFNLQPFFFMFVTLTKQSKDEINLF